MELTSNPDGLLVRVVFMSAPRSHVAHIFELNREAHTCIQRVEKAEVSTRRASAGRENLRGRSGNRGRVWFYKTPTCFLSHPDADKMSTNVQKHARRKANGRPNFAAE